MRVNICRRVKLTDYFYAEFKKTGEGTIDYSLVLGTIDGYDFNLVTLNRIINCTTVEDAIEYRTENTVVNNQYSVSIHNRVVEIIPNLYEENLGLIDDGFSINIMTGNDEYSYLVKSSNELANKLNCAKAVVIEGTVSGDIVVYTYDKDKFFLGAYRFNKK